MFYRGRHEEFKDLFSQEDDVVFATMFVLLWKFLFVNITQIDSPKVSLNVILLHNGNRFSSVPWGHAASMNESYESIWESLSMTNLSGSCVVISRLWHCYSECNSGKQNTAVSCASGSAGTRRITI